VKGIKCVCNHWRKNVVERVVDRQCVRVWVGGGGGGGGQCGWMGGYVTTHTELGSSNTTAPSVFPPSSLGSTGRGAVNHCWGSMTLILSTMYLGPVCV
jgi:hypothetical protein